MSVSRYPSRLSLPQDCSGVASVLDHLVARFPAVGRATWRQRMADGKVHWHDGSPVTPGSPCRPQQRVYYYREVADEAVIPFAETVLYQDEHILVADKPHFLPVTAGGRHVDECLQNRLRASTGCEALQAVHRLDRVTAGLVLFSTDPATRHLYHALFSAHRIEKTYYAIAAVGSAGPLVGRQWVVKNRLVRTRSRFRMMIAAGESNSHSLVRCLRQSGGTALFELQAITGKTHQLRLHMQELGWPILNDTFYPRLQPRAADDYARPLQLLAKQLRFVDPVTRQPRVFRSEMTLDPGADT